VWTIKLSHQFLELIGAELVPTLKIEIVPDGMVYMCANLYKIWSYRSICSKGPNMAIQHRFQTGTFHRFCLTLSHFKNAITSWILELACACQQDCSTRTVEHNGTILVQVRAKMKLWQCFQFSYVFSSRLIPGICLTDDIFENSISSSFVRYYLCMSA
jgi:hypothetical protein